MKGIFIAAFFLVLITVLVIIGMSISAAFVQNNAIYTFPDGLTPVFRRGTNGAYFICVDTNGVYQDCEAVITYKGE